MIIEIIAIFGIILKRTFEIATKVTKVEVSVFNTMKDIITSNTIVEVITILLNTYLI